MIDIKQLKLSDKGRKVRYRGHDFTEWGVISDWNERVVFVRYHTRVFDSDLRKRQLHPVASQGTNPRDLEFVDE